MYEYYAFLINYSNGRGWTARFICLRLVTNMTPLCYSVSLCRFPFRGQRSESSSINFMQIEQSLRAAETPRVSRSQAGRRCQNKRSFKMSGINKTLVLTKRVTVARPLQASRIIKPSAEPLTLGLDQVCHITNRVSHWTCASKYSLFRKTKA